MFDDPLTKNSNSTTNSERLNTKQSKSDQHQDTSTSVKPTVKLDQGPPVEDMFVYSDETKTPVAKVKIAPATQFGIDKEMPRSSADGSKTGGSRSSGFHDKISATTGIDDSGLRRGDGQKSRFNNLEFDMDSNKIPKKTMIAIVIVIVFVVALGAVAFWWFKLRETKSDVLNTNEPTLETNQDNSSPVIIDNKPSTTQVLETSNDVIVTPPIIIDSDQDGLSDDEEILLGTNPFNADSDNDKLFDKEEVKVYLTNPLKPDTDNDGYLDGEEVANGYNPKGSGLLLKPDN